MVDDKTTGGDNQNKSGGDDQVAALQAKLDTANAEIESANQAKQATDEKLAEVDKELLSPEYIKFKEGNVKGMAEPTKSDDDTDFEDMSIKEVVVLMRKERKADLKTLNDDLGGSIAANEKRIGDVWADADVKRAEIRHPDFGEHTDAMFKLTKENPTWNSEKLYTEVKKQIKFDADEKVAVEKEKEDKKRTDAKLAFSEKGGPSKSLVKGKNLTKQEASDLAWQESQGASEVVE